MKKILKWGGIALGAILVVYLIDTKGGTTKGGVLFPVKESKPEPAKLWYQGGTLHNATAVEWRKATQENKLATCADFVARAKKYYKSNFLTMDEYKAAATELESCIDKAIGQSGNDTMRVNEFGGACYVLMNYKK